MSAVAAPLLTWNWLEAGFSHSDSTPTCCPASKGLGGPAALIRSPLLLPCLQVLNISSVAAPASGQPLLAPLAHCAAGLHTLQVEYCTCSELPEGPYLAR